MTRRVFCAFDLDEACRQAATRLVERLCRVPEFRRHGENRIRWVPPENLHVTVRFLGAMRESAVCELQAVLARPLTSRAFHLQFEGVGMFPDRGGPRVIWIGVTDGAAKAERVCRELDERLARLERVRERRVLRPHVTVGRFRQPGSASVRRAIRGLTMNSFEALLVDHLTVYESHLSSRGARYVPLVRTPLRPMEAVGA